MCVKRLFAEMQTCTERDLGRMRDELNTSTRDVDRAFAGFNTCVVLSAQSEVSIVLNKHTDKRVVKG